MSKIDIAVGKHRKEEFWKNKSVEWSDFVERCSKTHYTPETLAVYLAAPKSRQDEIKDVGAFVGGYLVNGKRNKDTVSYRQLVTLDADFATPDLWFDFCLAFSCAAIVYSTHKHTPGKPRLRLIIPLDRTVSADEFEAISRKIAGTLGIEQFDHTTYQVNRLMYWPSTSSDAEFFFQEQEGEFLEADSILAQYHNWHDTSEWPVSDSETEAIKTGIKRQGDPTEKDGVIGAFCRIYGIDEAIETFLSDVYEACDVDNRYTYTGGSTAAGVIVYENKWAYSHHGTDPTSGKLCNAFDLVRIHKFGYQDDNKKADTPVNKLPSYLAMQEFASKDEAVKKLMVSERIASAQEDFGTVEGEDEDELFEDLAKSLEVDRNGKPLGTIRNVELILSKDPKLSGCLALDQFERREVLLRDLPWRKRSENRYMTDADDARIRSYIETVYGISSPSKIQDALTITVNNNGFHPVRDYLESRNWDGIERIDTLLVEYLGADDDVYTRAVTRKTLVAAVARIFEPGKKFDYVLTFVGEQGMKKSSFIAALGGEWFSDSFGDIEKKKEVMEQIQGVWLIEIGEMAGMRKADVQSIKQFISKRDDRYRVAYGRRVEYFPRQCVFFATTNDTDFLRDPTGNRRFWPVKVYKDRAEKDAFSDLNEYERGQIWAEAVELYRKGETLYLSPELEALAREVQEEHTERDEREGVVMKYLETLLPSNWDEMSQVQRRMYAEYGDEENPGITRRERVCVAEIWCEALGGNQKDMTTNNTKFLHDIMKKIKGWHPAKSKLQFKGYGKQKGYLIQNAVSNVGLLEA